MRLLRSYSSSSPRIQLEGTLRHYRQRIYSMKGGERCQLQEKNQVKVFILAQTADKQWFLMMILIHYRLARIVVARSIYRRGR